MKYSITISASARYSLGFAFASRAQSRLAGFAIAVLALLHGLSAPAHAQLDDRPAMRLASVLVEADAVALVRIETPVGDGSWLRVRIEASATGPLETGRRYCVANPRLRPGAGMLHADDRLIMALFQGEDGRWRPIEFGGLAAYRVDGDRVRAPDPGSDDAVNAGRVWFDVARFLDAVRGCGPPDRGACTERLQAARINSDAD